MNTIDRGDTLFSLSLVLALILIAAPIGYQRYSDYLQLQEWNLTAQQTDVFSAASSKYLEDHYAELQHQLLVEKNVVVTGAELQQKGYIDPHISLVNNVGQNYSIYFTLDNLTDKNISALLISQNGSELNEKAMRYISRLMHGESGFISADNQATGIDGGWSLDTGLSGIPAAHGHLISLISADIQHSVFKESDRLYRYQVAGHPELNQMHADIDLAGHQLRHAGGIDAVNIAVNNTVSADNLQAHSIVHSDGSITAETDIRTVAGSLVTRGSHGWINSTHNGGFYMDDDDWVKVWKDKGIETAGEIKSGKLTAEGRVTANEYLNIKGNATLNSQCDEEGLIANGGGAGILDCYGGVWTGFMKNSIHLSSLGAQNGIYKGKNGTGEMVWLSATGGNSVLSRVAGDGYCYNFANLAATVNGVLVASNSTQGKDITPSTSLIFAVPPGEAFTVTSLPGSKYGCGYGKFSMAAYQ